MHAHVNGVPVDLGRASSSAGKSSVDRSALLAMRARVHENAKAAIGQGRPERAVADLERWTAVDRACPDLLFEKGRAYASLGRHEDALAAMQLAVRLMPRLPWLLALARQAARVGAAGLERSSLVAARKQGALPIALARRLARLHLDAGAGVDALQLADEELRRADDLPLRFVRVRALLQGRKAAEAAVELQTILAHSGRTDRDLCDWAEIVLNAFKNPALVARALLARTEAGGPCAWQVHLWLARALHALNRSSEAVGWLESGLRDRPEQPWLAYELGVVLRHLGDTDKAQQAFDKARRLAPGEVRILRVAGDGHRYEQGDEAFQHVQRAEARLESHAPSAQIEILYAAAKACDDVGDLDGAFARYAEAGARQKLLTPWSEEVERRRVAKLQRLFTPERVAQARLDGHPSDKPVFVFGMPRSGTSLVEQIIARHPEGAAAGEVTLAPEALHGALLNGERLATSAAPIGGAEASFADRGRRYVARLETVAGADAKRIVDKLPGHHAWLGYLDIMLPGSRFVHCRRHPVDACLSMFKLYFGVDVPFSYDLADLASAYRLYHETMDLWRSVLAPGRILELRYEDLVAAPEVEARRLVESLDLEWTPACLDPGASQGALRTASANQARRPIYRDAVGRWRRYERHLGALLEGLGDLTAAYEQELAAKPRV